MCFGSNEKGGAYTKDMKYFDNNNKMKNLPQKSFQKYPALSKALKLISLESKNKEGKTRNKESAHPVKRKKNKPEKMCNDLLENVNKTKTQTNKSSLLEADGVMEQEADGVMEQEADDVMEQEETQVISQENTTKIDEAEKLNTEHSNQNPMKGSKNNDTSFEENTFNYEINIENDSTSTTLNENIAIEEDGEIQKKQTKWN